MLILSVILVLLVIIAYVRYSNNIEIANQHIKTEEDVANIKNAQKVFRKTKEELLILLAAILILVVFLLCDFTNLEAVIIDFFSTDFYYEQAFDRTLYFIPAFIFVAREIIIQVKVGDFILKYFQAEEPELEGNLLKSLLYKKAPVQTTENNQGETPEQTENQPSEQPPQEPPQENIEIPQEKDANQ